ncbi:MAG: hypothetical protein QE274_12835 [Verrucomicrobiaceae bacterium]|nr:hypothetical protein [Verrucomicrobiaceae bacterium]
MSRPIKDPVSGFSPYYGCVIIAAAAAIFFGIIAWSAYTLFRQDAEIDQFTIASATLPPRVELSTEETQTLTAKATALQQAITSGKSASLSLTLAELNALVAKAPDLGNGSYADIVRFTGTNPEKKLLLADIALPLNPLPFSGKPKRYLVGKASFQVEVTTEGPDARIIAIDVPGKTIPAGFIESQQAWTWITPYHQDPTLSSTLKALRSARVTPEGLTLSTQPE